jgi:AIPR protein
MYVKNLSQLPYSGKSSLESSKGMPSPPPSKSRTVTEEQLSELHKALSPKCGGHREDYFGVAYISSRFGISPEQLLSNVAFGGTEFGVDGYYHDKPNRTLYLFVFRWSEDHMSFKDPLTKLGNKGIDKIFVDVTKSPDDPSMITFLKTDLFQNWKSIDKVVIDFVFNGDPVDAEQSKVLTLLRETVEDKNGIIDSYFSRVDRPDHVQIFRYVSNQRSLGHTTSSRDSVEYIVEITDTLKVAGGQNEMMVALLSLDTLHQMYSDLGERLFEKNIRSGLDDGSMTNSHIKKSLERIISGDEPFVNFTLYHNGITLTAQKLESDGAQLRMVEPRILNGAQTIKILKQFVDEREETENLRDGLAGTKVMTRIINSGDNDFLKKVTINNNRQNPIMPWNLRANDVIQVGFEELFAKLGIYYERRENAYKNLTEDDLEVVGTEKGVIEIRKFAQTLLAMRGQIDRISEMKEVFENEAWYSDTFKERYLEVDPRKFVLLYKVQFRLPSLIREIRNAGSEKYGFITRARNLVWCLLLHGLINDNKFGKYVEQYGNSIGIEAGLAELLKTMAKSKLRFVLSDALEGKKYHTSIAEGKVSFLGSKTLLNDCMEKARGRFGWDKTYL